MAVPCIAQPNNSSNIEPTLTPDTQPPVSTPTQQETIVTNSTQNTATNDKHMQAWQLWVNQTHTNINDSLEYGVNWLNDSFYNESSESVTQPSKKALYRLNFINDLKWRDTQSFSNDFRVRGRVKLPALKYRWRLIFDDPDFEDQTTPSLLQLPTVSEETAVSEKEEPRIVNKLKNQTLAIGVSISKPESPFYSDINVGLRQQDDIYLRNKLGVFIPTTAISKLQLQQILRYGSQSRFYTESSLLATQNTRLSPTVWRYRAAYTYADGPVGNHIVTWSHTLSYQYVWPGQRDLTLGWLLDGDIHEHNHRQLQRGPWIYWHQPIWSDWLFIGLEATYFQRLAEEEEPQFGLLFRLETLFGNF